MALYDKDGNQLVTCYDSSGNAITAAYDSNGNVVWIADRQIVVCNYNVGQWYIGSSERIPVDKKEEYTELQTTIFNNIRPDICLMQEATSTFCQDGTLAKDFLSQWFEYIEITRGSSGFQAHMMATKDIPIEDYTVVPFVNASGNYPGYETAYITVNGKRIFLLNTHIITTPQYRQEAQIAEVMDAVADKEYFIVSGDFNLVIHDGSEEDYINCIKPFLDAGYHTANCGDFGIFPTYRRTEEANPQDGYEPATDHIITSANINIVNAYVDTTKLTDNIADKIDHVPLVAVLDIN